MDLSIETAESGPRNNTNVLYDAGGNIRIPIKRFYRKQFRR